MPRSEPLTVSVDGYPAGELRRVNGNTEFAYPMSSSTRTVATTLPVRAEPYTAPGTAVPPFFAGLLPEGRRLSALRRGLQISADDDFALLAHVGADTIGNVTVTQSAQPRAQYVATVTPEDMLDEEGRLESVDFTELFERSLQADPSHIPGVQDKMSGRMIGLPLSYAGANYLLKLDPPEYPHVVANEHYFLTLAKALRQPVASASIVRDRNGRMGLLGERFDRVASPEGLQRKAVEDACQLLNLYPGDKYNVTAEDACAAILRVSSSPRLAAAHCFEQFAFAYLTGNGDLHAKNLSVIRHDARWDVAPIYDIPATLVYGDARTALPIEGRSMNLSRKAWLAFATTLGLPQPVALRTLDRVVALARQALAEAPRRIPWTTRQQRDYERVIGRRIRECE